jgi:hypothetical protein
MEGFCPSIFFNRLTVSFILIMFISSEFGNVCDGETEGEGAEGVDEYGGVLATRDGGNDTTEALEGTGENLDFVVRTRKGVSVFNGTVGKGKDVTETLDLPVRHPGKGGKAIGGGRSRGVFDVTGKQEALFEDILTMTLIDTDKYLTGNDHPFLDMSRTVGPVDHFLLGSHVGLYFIWETIGGIEDFAAHEFVVPFDLRNVPCRGVERLVFEAFRHASGARP